MPLNLTYMQIQLINFLNMKKINLILGCIILFFSITSNAQSSFGRNNETNNEFQKEKRQEEIEKEKVKYIDKTISKLKTDIQLDALQEIAIRQIIVENSRIEGIILKKEESEQDKTKALTALYETTDTKITALLNPNQKLKYIELKENLKKKNK